MKNILLQASGMPSAGFTDPESKEESAKEAQRTAIRKYLQEVSGPLQALTKREATVPGEVIPETSLSPQWCDGSNSKNAPEDLVKPQKVL